ncbi:MAG TPA: YCF48-related protein [Candidatus Angelobacter sp.]
MPELTTILRQRLGAGEDPKVHPDPDTLTAYVEELLPGAERNTVLEHISLCSQCREVVSLTMPERAVAAEEAEEPVAVAASLPTPRRWWFLTPRFGMAASLAAVAAGVFLVLKIPQMHKQAPVETASVTLRQDAPVPAAPSLQDNNGATTSLAVTQPEAPTTKARSFSGAPAARVEERDKLTTLAGAVAPAKLAPAQNQPMITATAASSRSDYVNVQAFASQAFAVDTVNAPAQEVPVAPSPARPSFALNKQSFANQNGSGTLSNAFLAPPSAAGRNQGTISVYPLSGPDHQSSLVSKVAVLGRQLHLKRQVPAISAENANNYAMFSPGLGKSEAAELAAKSADSGAASELGQSSAFSSNGLRGRPSALDMGANSFLWKVLQGKLLKSSDLEHWLDGYPAADGVEFTVVTASGADVWAGGKDAALVHSRDGGLTWERITLGAAATGSLTGIEVSRSTIRVRSSSGQGWMSQDGGRSWVILPQ